MTALQLINNKELSSLDDQVRATIDNSISKNTLRAYKRIIQDFTAFTVGQNITENLIIHYLQSKALKGNKISTINQALAAISFYLRMQDNTTDTIANSVRVKQFVRGLARMKAEQPVKKAKPITAEVIKSMVDKTDCLRDKALLLLGWSAALRRSEIAAIRVRDIEFKPEGLVLTIIKSKTDQTGEGQTVAVLRAENKVYCPVGAVIAWITSEGLNEADLLFSGRRGKLLSGQAVANIIKKYAGADFSAHGLRSGFMTSAANKGAGLLKITEVSRHKDFRVAMGYIKEADKFNNHAGDGLL